jgi:hypothetical protein
VRGQPKIAGNRCHASGAKRYAIDHSDHGLRQPLERQINICLAQAQVPRLRRCERRKFDHIIPGTERFAGAGKHHDPHIFRMPRQPLHHPFQFGRHQPIHGVEKAWAVQGDRGNPVGHGHQQGLQIRQLATVRNEGHGPSSIATHVSHILQEPAQGHDGAAVRAAADFAVAVIGLHGEIDTPPVNGVDAGQPPNRGAQNSRAEVLNVHLYTHGFLTILKEWTQRLAGRAFHQHDHRGRGKHGRLG